MTTRPLWLVWVLGLAALAVAGLSVWTEAHFTKQSISTELQEARATMQACPVAIETGWTSAFDLFHPRYGVKVGAKIGFSVDGGLEKTEWAIPDLAVQRTEADLEVRNAFLGKTSSDPSKTAPAWRATHGPRFTMKDQGTVYEVELLGDSFAALVLRENATGDAKTRRLRVLFPSEIGMRVTANGRVSEGRWQFPGLATGWIDYSLCDLAPLLRLREVVLSVAANAAPVTHP